MAILAADFATARRSDWTLPVVVYALFATVLIAALHSTAFAMARTWFSASAYHHGVAVAPLALWMILTRPRLDPATGPLALVPLAGAAFLWLAGRAAGVALVEQIALVTMLIAGAWAMFGSGAMRLWALPLLFLYFMVPFGEVLIPLLQQATAKTVVVLLNFFGFNAAIDGLVIATSAGRFEIAEACAGLNFLLAALMVAWVYASQTLHRFKTRIAFVAIAAFIAITANIARSFLLILIATMSEMKFAVGPDHLLIGLIFYAAVFFVLFRIGAAMKKPHGLGPEHAPVRARRAWRWPVALAAFLPVIALPLIAAKTVNKETTAMTLTYKKLSAPGWRMLGAPQNWTPSLNADHLESVTYEKNGERVYVSLGWFASDRQGREIVNALNSPADGKDWRVIAEEPSPIFIFGEMRTAPLSILAGPDRRRLVVLTLYWRGDDVYTNELAFKWAQMKDKLKGVNPPGGVMMIASDYAGEPSAAIARLRAYGANVEDFSEWRARSKAAP